MGVIAKLHSAINGIFGDQDIAAVPGIDLSGMSHVSELLPYRHYHDTFGLFECERSSGFIIEMSPISGADETVVKSITSLVADLPTGSCVQIIGWGSRFYGPALERWARPRIQKGGIHAETARSRIRHLSRATWAPATDGSNVILRHHRVIMAVGLPGRLTDALSDTLLSIRENCGMTLKGMGIGWASLTAEDLISIVREWLDPREDDHRPLRSAEGHPDGWPDDLLFDSKIPEAPDFLFPDYSRYDPNILLNKQCSTPRMRVSLRPSHIDLAGGDFECHSYTVRDYPEKWAQWWMSRLIGHPINPFQVLRSPYRQTLTFRVLDQDAAKAKASTRSIKLTHDLEKGGALYRPQLAAEAQEWRFVNQKMEEGNKMFSVVSTVDVWARKKDATRACRALEQLYRGQSWKLEKERFTQVAFFLAGFPLTSAEGLMVDFETMGRTKPMLSWTVANVAPFQGEYQGTERPQVLIIGRRGQVATLSPFDNRSGNHNICVVGKSGAGKSVFMQELNEGCVAIGGRARIIDDGKSFLKAVTLQGGEVVQFGEGRSPRINPFALIDPSIMAVDEEYRNETFTFIRSALCSMASPFAPLDSVQRGFIDKAMDLAYSKEGDTASPELVARFLEEETDPRAKDLATSMTPFRQNGIFGRYVNGGLNIDITNPLVLFELGEIKSRKELLGVVMQLCMFLISQEMYRLPRGVPKMLTIDEAWALLNAPGIEEFIEGFVRRCRKYTGSLCTGTQSFADYFQSTGAQACFANSDYFFLLSQRKESIDQLRDSKKIAMTEQQEALLKSLEVQEGEYSEIAVMGPNNLFAVGRIILDPLSMAIASSKGSEFEAIDRAQQSGMSLLQAVRHVGKTLHSRG